MSSERELPLPTVHVHKNGTYSHVSYRINDQNQIIQLKRILRIGRDIEASKKAIENRQKNWSKFGLGTFNDDEENQLTRLDTEFQVKLVQTPEELDAPESMLESAQRKLKDNSIKCRFCGGPHWSKECPSKDIIESLKEVSASVLGNDAPVDQGTHSSSSKPPPPGRYVPPSARKMGEGGDDRPGTSMPPRRMDDSFAVRIANLPEEMTDQDLSALCSGFGHVARSYLAKQDNGACKGYAFVNFSSFSSAEACVQRLSGYGYANLILTCEHSKPRAK